GEATQAQIAGFLVALRAKGETADEIAGCAEAMREHVLRVNPKRHDLVDIVGTGGDGANTFNISTAAALVASAAGAAIAKHGNRAASSASGAADVLEALGFKLDLPPERIEQSIDELGFGFLFAQAHHPAMKHAAPVRRELATRTVFNVLGPLTNPAGARALMLGVYSPALTRTLAEALVRPEPRVRGGERLGARVRARSGRSRRRALRSLGTAWRRSHVERGGAARRALRRGQGRPPFRRHPQRSGRHRGRGAGRKAARGDRRRPRGDRQRRRGVAARRARGVLERMRFKDALSGPGLAAIAEFKRRSPSMGDIRPDARVEDVIRTYSANGASAISVLVDERFAGTIDDLVAARAATSAPLLAKGFFSTEEQLLELRRAGADAALLILRDLEDGTTERLMRYADEIGLDTLVEAHDETELERAHRLHASIIGINARDLSTFQIDRAAQLALVARAACDVVIAESAIHSRAQGAAAELAGADAVLVGTSLMQAPDPGAKLRDLVSRPLVKVCGLTRQEDVDAAVEAGADLTGFIFAEGSPRRAPAVLAVPDTVLSVAVFVGEPEERGA